MRPFTRGTALVLTATLASTTLAGCKKDDAVQQLVLAALSRSMTTPHSFLHVDQDLDHRTTVSGDVADSLRYRMLLNVDGKPIWQEVVRDDAVADLFLDPKQVSTYAGAGSAPAVDVVTDYQRLAQFLPKNVPAPNFSQLPRTQPVQPTLGLLSLRAGKWVVDTHGAPVLPSVGTSESKLATTPFLRPLLMIAAVREEVKKLQPQWIKKYSKDDLSPFFKPKDDPFPLPQAGTDRYDVSEAPLPQITATSKGSRPDAPSDEATRKLAIYIKDGKVVAIRESYDILDRLQDMARLYQVPLKLNTAAPISFEQAIGELFIDLVQAPRPIPFREHEEQLLLTYPGSAPVVSLPHPAVDADLSLLPGQGQTTASTSS